MEKTKQRLIKEFLLRVLESPNKTSSINNSKQILEKYYKETDFETNYIEDNYENLYSTIERTSKIILSGKLKWHYFIWQSTIISTIKCMKYDTLKCLRTFFIFIVALIAFISSIDPAINYIKSFCDDPCNKHNKDKPLKVSFLEGKHDNDSKVVQFSLHAARSFVYEDNIIDNGHYTKYLSVKSYDHEFYRDDKKKKKIENCSDITFKINESLDENVKNKIYIENNYVKDFKKELIALKIPVDSFDWIDLSYFYSPAKTERDFANFSLEKDCACILASIIGTTLALHGKNEFLDSLKKAIPKDCCPMKDFLKGYNLAMHNFRNKSEKDFKVINNLLLENKDIVDKISDTNLLVITYNEIGEAFEAINSPFEASDAKEISAMLMPENDVLRSKHYKYSESLINNTSYFNNLNEKQRLDLLVRGYRDCNKLSDYLSKEDLNESCFQEVLDNYQIFSLYYDLYNLQSTIISDSTWRICDAHEDTIKIEFPFVYKNNTTLLNKEKDQKDIESIFRIIKKHNVSNVTIYGHASREGPIKLNTFLGLERAKEIKHFSKFKKVKVESKGSSKPIYPDSTKNRRAELIILN